MKNAPEGAFFIGGVGNGRYPIVFALIGLGP